MKKICQIILFFAMGIALVGCSIDYQKEIEAACENNDFGKAHKLLAEANKDLYGDEVENLTTFVFDKEVQYLISQDNDDSSKRLAYLFKEQKASKEYIYNYLDLGLKKENGILIQTLTNEFLNIVEFNRYKSGFEEEKRYVTLILDRCLEQGLPKPVITLYNKLQNREIILASKWGLNYSPELTLDVFSALMSFNNEKTNTILRNNIIANHSVIGNAHTDYRKSDSCNEADSHHRRYNMVCRTMLSAAISKRNKSIAEFVCSQAEPLCEKKFTSDGDTHCYILNYDNVKELKQMYENANFE